MGLLLLPSSQVSSKRQRGWSWNPRRVSTEKGRNSWEIPTGQRKSGDLKRISWSLKPPLKIQAAYWITLKQRCGWTPWNMKAATTWIFKGLSIFVQSKHIFPSKDCWSFMFANLPFFFGIGRTVRIFDSWVSRFASDRNQGCSWH